MAEINRDTELRLLAHQRTIEYSDPAQVMVVKLAAELLDLREAIRKTEHFCGECHNGSCATHRMLNKALKGESTQPPF